MSDSTISLSGKAGEAWERVFQPTRAQVDGMAGEPDDQRVNVMHGGKILETTTVGDLRARGVLTGGFKAGKSQAMREARAIHGS